MKSRFFFLTAGLVAGLLTFCAPAQPPTSAPMAFIPTIESQPLVVPTSTVFIPVPESATQPATEIPATNTPEVLAVATSRGPNLEATDPTTVSLASGSLQLVEFFRFT